MKVTTEYKVEALLQNRDEPVSEAEWVEWNSPREDRSDLNRALDALARLKAAALSGTSRGQVYVLDYRVVKRTITISDWELALDQG